MSATKSKEVIDFVLYQKDNNLDLADNLELIPEAPALYAVFGRINGAPANCRYAGVTNNLRASIKDHFSENEPHLCLRQFMRSIKIKTMNYLIIDEVPANELMAMKEAWEQLYKPDCTEKLNEVF